MAAQIGEAGGVALANAASLSASLVRLNLANNPLSDVALKACGNAIVTGARKLIPIDPLSRNSRA